MPSSDSAEVDDSLDVCLDQVEYMGELLRLEELVERIRRYIKLRSSGMRLENPGIADELLGSIQK
jgi:hypothetical protein